MATELLPVVDLRALSQSDLDALAAASAHALAPRSCPDADPLQPLKIDRAVFNESAGSRKQTFSRLRLGAASSSARATSSSSAPPSSARNDPDSRLVAYHLRRLFTPDDPSLQTPPESQTLALTEPSPSPPRSPPPDPDRETTNSRGVSVDLVRLAGTVDPYDAELRRRTAGMASDTELMGFIASVAGQWASQRQRRKFVDASFFGDHLPRGWKLLLGLKRKERMTWVHCFSYVSPKGNRFDTCKEVSAYLMSLLGYPEASTVTKSNSTGQHDLCADKGGDDASFKQHHLSSHETSAKRRRTGKFGEPIVGRDGKFECPVCHKTFEEESRYFGHIGAHARYQGMTPEAFSHMIFSGKADSNSLAEISFSFQELTESPEQNNKISAAETCFQHLTGSNEHGGNSSNVKELFSTDCLDSFNRPNKAWGRPEEIPRVTYAPSTFRTTNSYEDQIIDPGISAPKHGEVNNTVKARDVNLNSRLNINSESMVRSFPTASANNEMSTSLNEANQSSFTGKCFSGSYNNSVVGGGFHERGFAQFSNSFTHMKPTVSSHCSIPESNQLKVTNLTKGNDVNFMKGSLVNRSDVNCMRDSSVDRPINNNESNVFMRQLMGKSSNEMQNRYNDCAPGCVQLAAASTSQNVNSLMSAQANFGSMSSMVRSLGDVPMSSTAQDQCDLQLGFGAQKQQIFSGYGEFRSTPVGSPQPDCMPSNNSLPSGSSQVGSMARPNSFPNGSPQFGSLARPTLVPTSFQFGIMARPNSVPPAESSQFGSMPRPSVSHAKSSQFGIMARPNSVPPAESQFGRMARPNAVPHAESSQFRSMSGPNSVPPADSSQFGGMARSNSHPAESSQFGSMPRQNFLSRTEPTLVLGYALPMGNGPPVQVGWDLSSSKVNGGMITCVCISCNSQFHHFGSFDGQQPVSFDLICPACKDKVSGHRMPNNGSWQP